MSDYENNSEMRGNGDDNAGNRQIPRGEREWDALLRRAQNEVDRFIRFYEKSFCDATASEIESDLDRLDECARAMGWQTVPDDVDADADDNVPAADPLCLNESANEPDARERDDDASDVYSLYNPPESIAVSAICTCVCFHLKLLQKHVPGAEKSSLAWIAISLTETLNAARRNLTLAVDAENALEFGLAVCLTKRAHAELNRYFADFEKLTENLRGDSEIRHARQIRCALMDLRDICLRILRDARAELEKKHD